MAEQDHWLKAETDDELNELLDMFWGFHDFKIEQVHYTSSINQIDLLMEYDTHEFSVLLRFIGNVSMNFIPIQDYEADWLMGSSFRRNNRGQIVWIASDDIDTNDIPNDVLWIAGDNLRYVYLDEKRQSLKLPEDIVHQVWHSLNFDSGKYEDTKKDFHPNYCKKDEDTSKG